MNPTEILPVYVGFDEREKEAVEVCKHSLQRHASIPTFPIEMRERMLRYIEMYDRKSEERDGVRHDAIDGKPFSTEFAFTRFLVCAMTQYYDGWALFQDCDMLWRGDIRELLELRDDKYAVMVVKHDHQPTEKRKMDGQKQETYPRKNWSSFMLFNCAHPSNRYLTVNAVNTEPGRWLHNFGWLQDHEIGELPVEWNWLEGWSSPDIDPKVVHFTRGGPWFEDYKNVPYADEWLREKALIEASDVTTRRRAQLAFTGGR